MNHKSGGDMKKIHRLGEYFIEVWKSLGIDNCDSVQILWARDEIGSNAAYWELVMDIAQTFTVKRITRLSFNIFYNDYSIFNLLFRCS